jgi:hypothetical protein
MKPVLADGNKSAAQHFMLANTPLYIVRKLRREQLVVRFAQITTGRVLYDNFIESISSPGSDLYEEVNPYIFLVALLIKREKTFLVEALKADARHHKWIREILAFLVAECSPVNQFMLDASAYNKPSVVVSTRPRSTILVQ